MVSDAVRGLLGTCLNVRAGYDRHLLTEIEREPMATKIEWTDGTWNPTECVKGSTGCEKCYAKAFAERCRAAIDHMGTDADQD